MIKDDSDEDNGGVLFNKLAGRRADDDVPFRKIELRCVNGRAWVELRDLRDMRRQVPASEGWLR